MESLWLDIKYAFARFRAEPITTGIVIITLALGIGVSTAIFSVVNGVLIQAFPFEQGDSLVAIKQTQPAGGNASIDFSAQEIQDYREQAEHLGELAEYHQMTFTMYSQEGPLLVRTGVVSSNFFTDLLSLEPHLGRLFTAAEDDLGAEPLVVLSYDFWQREFNGREDVINGNVEMNNRLHKIIGVLPDYPQFPDVNDLYMAVPSCPWRSGESALSRRDARFLSAYGKLKPDSSMQVANQQFSSIAERALSGFPAVYSAEKGLAITAVALDEELVKEIRTYLLMLLGTTVMVLLIASANVTNITLSQHAKRRRELAVRASIGASRLTIARQLLTESILLALLAGSLGLLLTVLGLDTLIAFADQFTSRASEISVDVNVMLFAMALSLLSGIIAGSAPSLAKINLVRDLKEGGKATFTTRNQPLRNLLLVAQFAFSLVLTVMAGLTIKSLQELGEVDLGYNPGNVKAVQMDMNWSIYVEPEQQLQFSREILQNVSQLPGIEQASISMTYPMDKVGTGFFIVRSPVLLDDRDIDPDNTVPSFFIRPVDHNYMDLTGVELLYGRSLDSRDDESAQLVTIVNESLARKFWPNAADAINRNLSIDNGENWRKIVGVVKDVKQVSPTQTGNHQLYLPLPQFPVGHIAILANTSMPMQTYVDNVKAIVQQIDSKQPLATTESLRAALDNTVAIQRFIAQLLSIFSATAVLITIAGVSGIMAYLVSVRTREIGLRVAIGASKARIITMIIGYGIRLAALGLAIGLLVTLGIAQEISTMLFNVDYYEVWIYAAAIAGLLVIAVVACALPALKASSISPMSALRTT